MRRDAAAGRPRRSQQPAGRSVLIALLAILAWASVPLGSNRMWSMALLAALLLGLAFVLTIARMWRLSAWPLADPSTQLPLILLAAWAAYTLLQTVLIPMSVIRILSPSAYEIWSATGVRDMASLSLARGDSFARGLHLASLAALFALAASALCNWRRLQFAAAAIVAMGALQALLGISIALGRSSGWLVSGPVEGVGGISGTFVNPNHFAGFLEMCLCVCVGLTVGQRGYGVSFSGRRQFLLSVLEVLLSPRLLLLAAQLLMIVALLWSGSRGALLSVVLAIVVTFLGLLPVRRNAGTPSRLRALGGVVLIAVLALVWGGPGVVADKFAASGVSSQRGELALATAAMGADFALAGAGAGSFKSVFPAYKTDVLGLREYEHAHNDFLEFFAEGGAIGLGLFLSVLVVCLGRTLRYARARQSRAARALCAGCVAACLSLMVHALFDFNLQIPANASLFVFILAMGLVAATLPRGSNRAQPLDLQAD